MIRWIYYPNSDAPDEIVNNIIDEFIKIEEQIDSEKHDIQESNQVLNIIKPGLQKIGFSVETGKRREDKIFVPVLFGLNGRVEKYFNADAYHKNEKWVIEIEAGRAYTNYQFLKDLFQACVMHDVFYLGIAVRNIYKGRDDFLKIKNFFDTLYASGRLNLPLKGVLLIGY